MGVSVIVFQFVPSENGIDDTDENRKKLFSNFESFCV